MILPRNFPVKSLPISMIVLPGYLSTNFTINKVINKKVKLPTVNTIRLSGPANLARDAGIDNIPIPNMVPVSTENN